MFIGLAAAVRGTADSRRSGGGVAVIRSISARRAGGVSRRIARPCVVVVLTAPLGGT